HQTAYTPAYLTFLKSKLQPLAGRPTFSVSSSVLQHLSSTPPSRSLVQLARTSFTASPSSWIRSWMTSPGSPFLLTSPPVFRKRGPSSPFLRTFQLPPLIRINERTNGRPPFLPSSALKPLRLLQFRPNHVGVKLIGKTYSFPPLNHFNCSTQSPNLVLWSSSGRTTLTTANNKEMKRMKVG
ncbi:hypothetical protein BT69DRAFT_475623, partial [Atractiella rhizophila]